jgi:hypothetical protein
MMITDSGFMITDSGFMITDSGFMRTDRVLKYCGRSADFGRIRGYIAKVILSSKLPSNIFVICVLII